MTKYPTLLGVYGLEVGRDNAGFGGLSSCKKGLSIATSVRSQYGNFILTVFFSGAIVFPDREQMLCHMV